jgi:ankyrin repeat protein
MSGAGGAPAEEDLNVNIFTAAGDGHLDVVQRLVAGGVGVNAQDDFGYSPLHAAVS